MKLISYENVRKMYDKKIVLDDFNLDIEEGSISFILGLNGAGKTTIFRSTLGHTSINSGKIVFHKKPYRIAAIIENPVFYENMNGYENLMYTNILRGCCKDKNIIVDALSYVGLDVNNRKPVKKYSLGMRQRLKLAEAIIVKPTILFLDEPLNGLDPEGIDCIKKLLLKFNEEYGMTIVISSHLIKETEGIATHYTIINNGKNIVSLARDDLFDKLKCIEIDTDSIDVSFENLKKAFGNHCAFYKKEKCIRCFMKNESKKSFSELMEEFTVIMNGNLYHKVSRGTLDEYFLAQVKGG